MRPEHYRSACAFFFVQYVTTLTSGAGLYGIKSFRISPAIAIVARPPVRVLSGLKVWFQNFLYISGSHFAAIAASPSISNPRGRGGGQSVLQVPYRKAGHGMLSHLTGINLHVPNNWVCITSNDAINENFHDSFHSVTGYCGSYASCVLARESGPKADQCRPQIYAGGSMASIPLQGPALLSVSLSPSPAAMARDGG